MHDRRGRTPRFPGRLVTGQGGPPPASRPRGRVAAVTSRGDRWDRMTARRRAIAEAEAHRQEQVSAAEDPVANALDGGLLSRRGAPMLTGRPVVNRATAMGLPVTWRCSTMISSDIAGLDIEATDGGMWPLLEQPEPGITRRQTIEGLVLDLVLHGNVVWRVIERDDLGVPAAVRAIPTEDLWIHLDYLTRTITAYRWRSMTLDPSEVIHFRGICPAGWPLGISALAAMETSIGNAIGQDQAAAEMLISGWLPMVVISPRDPDQGLTQSEREDIHAAWDAKAGRDRGPIVLPGEVSADTLSFEPRRLQLLESREHSQREICTWMGVPPRMAGVPFPDSSTYQNVQQDQASYKARALMGWIGRIEATLSAELPLGVEARMDDTALDRGDPLTQAQQSLYEAQAAAQLVQAGVITPEAAAERCGYDPSDVPAPEPEPEPMVVAGATTADMMETAA